LSFPSGGFGGVVTLGSLAGLETTGL